MTLTSPPNPVAPAGLTGLARFLGLRRSMIGLLLMCILIGMGEKMAERFLPLYLLALGGGPWVVGLLNSLDNLLSALYSYPGGWLADRLGTKRALMIFNLVAMFGYAIVLAVPSYWAVLVGSVFFISWTALSLPATMSLIAQVLPKEKRTMGVSMHSLIRRIPMAIGPLIGGYLVTRYGERDGVRLAFWGAMAMAFVALIFQQVMIEPPPPKKAEEEGAVVGGFLTLIPARLRKLLVADILVRFCEQIPYPFLAIWCMHANKLSGMEFGLLTTVEMVTAMLVYIPVAYFADKSGKKGFVTATFAFFTAFPAALYFCRSFGWLILAFVIRGLKEFGEPTRKALILDLAPEGKKAAAFGEYYLVRDLFVAAGALSGAFFWKLGPHWNFLAAFLFGLAGTLWFAVAGEDVTPAPEEAV